MTTKQKVSINKTKQQYGGKQIKIRNTYIYIYYLPSNVTVEVKDVVTRLMSIALISQFGRGFDWLFVIGML